MVCLLSIESFRIWKHMSNGSAVRVVTDGRTDGRYQVHYLPRFAVDNKLIKVPPFLAGFILNHQFVWVGGQAGIRLAGCWCTQFWFCSRSMGNAHVFFTGNDELLLKSIYRYNLNYFALKVSYIFMPIMSLRFMLILGIISISYGKRKRFDKWVSITCLLWIFLEHFWKRLSVCLSVCLLEL